MLLVHLVQGFRAHCVHLHATLLMLFHQLVNNAERQCCDTLHGAKR